MEKTTAREGANPSMERTGLFSRQEMESLVKGLTGSAWTKWLGDAAGTPILADQKLSSLSDQELEKLLTEILRDMF